MAGDFNDILSYEERWGGGGGNRPLPSRITGFRDCLNSCNMIDLGFSGPKFTWSSCHNITSLIMQRIYQALANPDWRILFPNATVTHLTHTHSDHYLILLSFYPSTSYNLPRPFCFENIWLSHPEFPNVIDQAWSSYAPNLSGTFDNFASLVTA